MLLSAVSPFFQRILTYATRACHACNGSGDGSAAAAAASSGGVQQFLPTLVVLPPEVEARDVRSLLEFVYRGETAVDGDRVTAVFKAATQLEVRK